jgi:membrane-bound lytic murein transglycosylase MltF
MPATTAIDTAAARSSAQAAPSASASGGDLLDASDQVMSEADEQAVVNPWTGDLDGMIERRYVRILCTFNRTNYFLDKAEQKGLTYEAGKAFETFLNKRAGMKTVKVHVAFIPVRHDKLFTSLAEGLGDIAASNLTITQEREKLATFAHPWIDDVREVLVLAPGQPPVLAVEDLSGREVHVRRSSSYYESLVALNEKFKAGGRKPVKIVEADPQFEENDLLEMANAALIPATIVDNHIADIWSKVFTDMQVVDHVAVRTGGRVAWAVRKNSPKLLDAINAFVDANPKGSAAFNIAFKKYFQNTKFVKDARSDEDVKRFRSMIANFQQYGNQYDFPWLLLAAQAYQESGINQDRVSSVGAVGVMQIKPSTAEGPPVFIKGVDKSAQRNIEAGTKYLRFIADQLGEEEGVDKINRGLFAFASYNAGPARIAGLRRKAAQRGLDPNKWFGNVEMVAAREIGQETVTYVANIYKYYVSYTLVVREMEARERNRSRQ